MSQLQVLVTTMNQVDTKKYEEMNLQTDVLFANQAERTDYCDRFVDANHIEMITTQTRGVGKNRNIALIHATGDILLIADDDMVYVDGYSKIVLEAFMEIRNADAIIFNIETIGMDPNRRINTKVKRLNYLNAFNYGAVRIAVKRKSLLREGITFNENFGGGTLYSAGEDSLFICAMLKRGLKLYAYPQKIADVKQFESTWFNGYNEKYFYDKGALFYALNPRLSFALCLQDLIRHRNLYSESKLKSTQILSLEKRGAKGYQNLKSYSNAED